MRSLKSHDQWNADPQPHYHPALVGYDSGCSSPTAHTPSAVANQSPLASMAETAETADTDMVAGAESASPQQCNVCEDETAVWECLDCRRNTVLCTDCHAHVHQRTQKQGHAKRLVAKLGPIVERASGHASHNLYDRMVRSDLHMVDISSDAATTRRSPRNGFGRSEDHNGKRRIARTLRIPPQNARFREDEPGLVQVSPAVLRGSGDDNRWC